MGLSDAQKWMDPQTGENPAFAYIQPDDVKQAFAQVYADLSPTRTVQFMGSVASASALPTTNTVGDMWFATDTGHVHIWTPTGWSDVGTVVSSGLPGPAGATGPAGPKGDPGVQGPAGVGISVRAPVADNAARDALAAVEGQLVLTLDSGIMWAYTGGAWQQAGQIVGPQGPAGPPGTLPNGTAAGQVLGWDGAAWNPTTSGEPRVIYVTAVGDGVADDTAAIQTALDSVPAEGAKVVLPRGKYSITAPLVMKPRTMLVGCQPTTDYHGYATSNPEVTCGFVVADTFTGNAALVPATACTIQDLAISGRWVGAVHGLQLPYAGSGPETNLLVTGLNIIKMGGDGVTGGAWAARFDQCYIGGCKGWGINPTFRLSDVRVSDTYINGNAKGGLNLDGSSTSGLLEFVAVRFERSGWSPDGQGTSVANGSPGIRLVKARYVTFTGCETDANSGNGVEVLCPDGGMSRLAHIKFVGCQFQRDGFGDLVTQQDYASVKLVGAAPTTGEVSLVSLIGCNNIRARATDSAPVKPAWDHPARGVWMENTSHIQIVGGYYEGALSTWWHGGRSLAGASNYRPLIDLPRRGLRTLPVQNATERTALDPFPGLIVYNSTTKSLEYYDGTSWTTVADAAAAMALPSGVNDMDILTWDSSTNGWVVTEDTLGDETNVTIPTSDADSQNGTLIYDPNNNTWDVRRLGVDDLAEVFGVQPNDGDVLVYDASLGKWVMDKVSVSGPTPFKGAVANAAALPTAVALGDTYVTLDNGHLHICTAVGPPPMYDDIGPAAKGVSAVEITQSAYDLLPVKDPDTLFLITGP